MSTTQPSARRWSLAGPALAFAAGFLALLPVVGNGFVDWDDPAFLTGNLAFRGFHAAQLRWMFSNALQSVYQPLAWLTLALDYKLWGLEPGGFHMTALLLHSLNAALVCVLARRLLDHARGPRPLNALGAVAAAVLFAVHPLRAESVAWASERHELVGDLFWLLSAVFYLAPSESGAPPRRAALAAFLLALLAKASMLTLPLVLLVLDFYPLRRLRSWRDLGRCVVEKAPFFVLACAVGVVGVVVLGRRQVEGDPWAHWTLLERATQAAYGLSFSAVKTLWPAKLSYLYEMPSPLDALRPAHLFAAVAVLGAAVSAVALRRRAPAWTALWAVYAATLLPVVGLLQFGPHITADRYSNLSCLGLFALGGGALAAAVERWRAPAQRAALCAAVAALALGLGAQARRQARYWKDSLSLWRRVLELDPLNAGVHQKLGAAALQAGRLEEAQAQCAEAARLQPDLLPAYETWAAALAAEGRWEEAAAVSQRELSRAPDREAARALLALADVRAGRVEDGEAQYRLALKLAPGDAQTHFNLGSLLTRLGRLDEARAEYEAALRLDPAYADADNNLGLLLAAAGRRREAFAHFRAALRSGGRARALAHLNWGNGLSDEGRFAAAERHYREAIRLDRGLLAARFALAGVLARSGEPLKAAQQYRALLDQAPWYEPARRDLEQVERLTGERDVDEDGDR